MKTKLIALGFTAVFTTAGVLALARNGQSPAPPSSAEDEILARGRYLTTRVGLCIDCHSPRDEKGNHIASQHLTGAPIGFAPTVPMPWMTYAPRLAGLPAGFTEVELVEFLMTGERPHNRPPHCRPCLPIALTKPMPWPWSPI